MRMRLLLALALTLAPVSADAQSSAKVSRIGFLFTPPAAAISGLVESFKRGLHERGYREGTNVAFAYRYADGEPQRLADLAADLVAWKPDIIVTGGIPATGAARNATATIPVVFANAGDPVAVGLVESLARPGRNVTGLSSNVSFDLYGKRLELLTQAIPGLSSVGMLRENSFIGRVQREQTEAAARSLGLNLRTREMAPHGGFEDAFQFFAGERVAGLLVPRNPISYRHRQRIAELSAKYRIPALYDEREYALAGGLFSYGTNHVDLYRRAAVFVDKILRGARPADLPVEQPTKFELVINLKTASGLGIVIPATLLARADEVIE